MVSKVFASLQTKHVPLVSLVSSGSEVMVALLLAHGVPDLRTSLVDCDIEDLGSDEETDVEAAYRDQNLVTGIVKRLVGLAVDLNISVSWERIIVATLNLHLCR